MIVLLLFLHSYFKTILDELYFIFFKDSRQTVPFRRTFPDFFRQTLKRREILQKMSENAQKIFRINIKFVHYFRIMWYNHIIENTTAR